MDSITRAMTVFSTFAELLAACIAGYSPTIRLDAYGWRGYQLADALDDALMAAGSPVRAWRSGRLPSGHRATETMDAVYEAYRDQRRRARVPRSSWALAWRRVELEMVARIEELRRGGAPVGMAQGYRDRAALSCEIAERESRDS